MFCLVYAPDQIHVKFDLRCFISIPNQTDAFKPHIWRRANFMFMSAFIQFCMMVQMEFSYSTPFSVLVYEFILIFKVIYFLLELFVFSPCIVDNLHFAPMVAAVACVSKFCYLCFVVVVCCVMLCVML